MEVSKIIIITVLVLILIFLISKIFFTTDIIYDIMCDANILANSEEANSGIQSFFATNKNVIANKDFNENNTSNFMLSVWFYIDNWGNSISEEKNIIYVSTKSNSITHEDLKSDLIGMSSSIEAVSTEPNPFKNLSICLDKYENNLLIDIETYSESAQPTGAIGATKFTRYKIKNIPVQKWNCLTLSVDTKTFDVYLDGKLRNSFILHGIYKNKMESNKRKNIYIGNLGTPNIGFEGFITRIRYQPNAINPQEAYNIYKEGISASLAKSMYNKYGLKVSFLEYNTERGSFTI
tara:strand:- start:712 stop:1587 length:876 start_codon:yes stop_codon:yes gene_type:complete